LSIAFVAGVACHGNTTDSDAGDAVATMTPPPELPAPFANIHIGMTEAELTAAYPPDEDIKACKAGLVGGFKPTPPMVPGAEKKPHSRCVGTLDVAGPTVKEAASFVAHLGDAPKSELTTIIDGMALTLAQVRGAVRAGALTEANIVAADESSSSTAHEAAVADALRSTTARSRS